MSETTDLDPMGFQGVDPGGDDAWWENPKPDTGAGLDDWKRLAEAWANVMDNTVTDHEWHEVAAEYARLKAEGS